MVGSWQSPYKGDIATNQAWQRKRRGIAMKDRLIEIELHKGCTLFLTPKEYKRGLRRGKAIKRSRQFKERQS